MSGHPVVLGLDAAYGEASACLITSDGRRFAAAGHEHLPHSQSILPLIAGLLEQAKLGWPNLQLLALGIGPGSFTGLRVAAASIAGINAPLQLPVLGVSSLAITAMQSRSCAPLWVVEDARAGEAYAGRHHAGKTLVADHGLSWEAAARLDPAEYVSRSAHVPLPRAWRRLPLERARPEALARLVMLRLAEIGDPDKLPRHVSPAYLQASQAERMAAHA